MLMTSMARGLKDNIESSLYVLMTSRVKVVNDNMGCSLYVDDFNC